MNYRHEYHQSIVYKILLCRKSVKEPLTNYSEALDIIKGIYQITRGLKQIVYLVGWQYEGHDSKYPAWGEANRRLMRKDDTDPRDGLRWLIREARAFNAIVSLHINMDDAYENSPLWDEYLKEDLLLKNQDGSLMKGDIWDGERCFWICKTREWQTGMAKRRIDQLIEYLPELLEAGTIHIDAFRPNPSAFHHIDIDMEIETAKSIYSYWSSMGIDVTNEYFSYHELAAYVPMVWILNLDEQSRLQYPPSVLCGGSNAWNQRTGKICNLPAWPGACFVPEAGTRYEEAWGFSCSSDLVAKPGCGAMTVSEMLYPFCKQTLPWHFLNRHQALELRQTAISYEVIFSDGIKSSIRVADRQHSITQNGRILLEGEDLCLPAPWLGNDFMIAWSTYGSKKRWELPPDWHDNMQVQVSRFDISGITRLGLLSVSNGILELEIPPQTALQLQRIS